jgi:hypothetical protein
MKDHLRSSRLAHANLLPVAFRRRLLIHKRIRQWVPVWLIATTTAVVLAYCGQRSLDSQREQLARLEQQTEPLHALVRENEQLRARLDELAGRQSLLAVLEPKLKPVQLLGLVSHCARQAEARVQLQNVALGPAPATAGIAAPPGSNRTTPSQPSGAPASPRLRLDLTGIATDDLAIAEFVSALRERGLFRAVELRSSEDARPDGDGGLHLREYTIECSLPGGDDL